MVTGVKNLQRREFQAEQGSCKIAWCHVLTGICLRHSKIDRNPKCLLQASNVILLGNARDGNYWDVTWGGKKSPHGNTLNKLNHETDMGWHGMTWDSMGRHGMTWWSLNLSVAQVSDLVSHVLDLFGQQLIARSSFHSSLTVKRKRLRKITKLNEIKIVGTMTEVCQFARVWLCRLPGHHFIVDLNIDQQAERLGHFVPKCTWIPTCTQSGRCSGHLGHG